MEKQKLKYRERGAVHRQLLSLCTEVNDLLNYYAGFIDGEAYIGIKKTPIKGRAKSPSYSERISVAGVSKLSIQGLQELWPGSFQYHKPGKNSRQGYWSWELTDKKAREFLKIIHPYLKIKALDAAIVLALSRSKENNGRKEISTEINKLRDDLYTVLKVHRKMAWSK